jgi:putative oxidoreductase
MSVPVYRDSLQGDRVPTQPGAREPAISNASDLTLALLRIVAGLMFVQHGVQKHFGLLLAPGFKFDGPPEVLSQLWIAGTLEIVGGVLFAIGFLTRPIAFLLAGEMAAAYFIAHAPQGVWPILNRGELAVLYCFVFLAFVGTGGGRYSIDGLILRRLGRRRSEAWDARVLGPTQRIRRGKSRVERSESRAP